jgi:hypothetical protein
MKYKREVWKQQLLYALSTIKANLLTGPEIVGVPNWPHRSTTSQN